MDRRTLHEQIAAGVGGDGVTPRNTAVWLAPALSALALSELVDELSAVRRLLEPLMQPRWVVDKPEFETGVRRADCPCGEPNPPECGPCTREQPCEYAKGRMDYWERQA